MAARIWNTKFVMQVKDALKEAGYHVTYDKETVVAKINKEDKMRDAVFTALLKSSSSDMWICRIVPGLIESVD